MNPQGHQNAFRNHALLLLSNQRTLDCPDLSLVKVVLAWPAPLAISEQEAY